MDIKDHLENFRAENAKVTLAAFADVEAGMVLAASGATKPAQETLDKLCAEAQSLLGDEAFNVKTIEFADAAVDVDTPEDLTRL